MFIILITWRRKCILLVIKLLLKWRVSTDVTPKAINVLTIGRNSLYIASNASAGRKQGQTQSESSRKSRTVRSQPIKIANNSLGKRDTKETVMNKFVAHFISYKFRSKIFSLSSTVWELRAATDKPLGNSRGPSPHPWGNVAQFDFKQRQTTILAAITNVARKVVFWWTKILFRNLLHWYLRHGKNCS